MHKNVLVEAVGRDRSCEPAWPIILELREPTSAADLTPDGAAAPV
jgi:hypothetical protein